MNGEASSPNWDCIIVGAGLAGLNAALVLGRARWRVLVLDNGAPRNYATHELHGVLGHDGLDPVGAACPRPRRAGVLRRSGRDARSPKRRGARRCGSSLVRWSCRVDANCSSGHGMLDEVPDIPGFADVWGTSAHTCPYCDGFEHRDERLAVLAAGDRGEHLAVLLRQWSDDVVLLSTGSHNLADDQLARVRASPSSRRPSLAWTATTGACAASGSATVRRSTATRCSSTSAGGCAPTSPAHSVASCAMTARSLSTPTRRRPSTVCTPPATAPTPGAGADGHRQRSHRCSGHQRPAELRGR
jgi:choline dehydrogenase-like flavoprotein